MGPAARSLRATVAVVGLDPTRSREALGSLAWKAHEAIAFDAAPLATRYLAVSDVDVVLVSGALGLEEASRLRTAVRAALGDDAPVFVLWTSIEGAVSAPAAAHEGWIVYEGDAGPELASELEGLAGARRRRRSSGVRARARSSSSS